MTASPQLSIRAVTAPDADAVAPLTWAAFRPLLDGADPSLGALCLAGWSGAVPVALVVSLAAPEPGQQILLSLTVAPPWRRQGVGRALLSALEAALADHGIHTLTTDFSDRLPGALPFSALLAAAGWNPPMAQRYRICGEVKDTAILFRDRERLLRRLQAAGFRAHCWRDRGEDGRALAERVVAEGAAPRWTLSADWEQKLDADLSLVITDAGDRAVGWVVCEYQPHLARLYYPIGWMVAPYDGSGWLLGAYAVGAELAAVKYGGATLAVIETGSQQHGMWRLFERHFQPHARWTDRLLHVSRHVGGGHG